MGGWAKLALGVLVAALVAVLIVSFTAGDDSTSPSTATVADGRSGSSADTKSDAGPGASEGSKDGGSGSGSAAAPAKEGGFTGSSGGEEGSGSNGSGGSKGSGKVGGSGATSGGSSKLGNAKKKKGPKAGSQAPNLDSETAAASTVLEVYMAARAAQNWPTACAQLAPGGIKSLERFAGPGRGCAATFAAVYPRLEPGAWANTMTGPITVLRADGVAIYHGTTGKDYAMPMVKEGGAWKVAALGPVVVA